MSTIKHFGLLLAALLGAAGLASCSDDDGDIAEPSFSQITITPQKDVYSVGDVITCTITLTSPGSDNLRDASYWWYASWWFADSELTADFQDFDDNGLCTSSTIELTTPGEVTLYFFGRLEYPNWDWRKVEIGRTIKVAE